MSWRSILKHHWGRHQDRKEWAKHRRRQEREQAIADQGTHEEPRDPRCRCRWCSHLEEVYGRPPGVCERHEED